VEPLQEYGQFAAIIKKLLIYRHQKHVQYEMTVDGLDGKREMLEDREKSETEAKRLEDALKRSSVIGRASGDASGQEGESMEASQESATTATPTSLSPPVPRRRTNTGGLGFLNALSYSLHGMMDVDPETARRNSISKTRDGISQLEDALHASAQDLKYASSTIQADLDRFQRQKVADIREMAISMARAHRDWCKKNLEAWEEAKKEIAKIEDHPGRPTPDDTATADAAPLPPTPAGAGSSTRKVSSNGIPR